MRCDVDLCSKRRSMAIVAITLLFGWKVADSVQAELPSEPIRIGHEPQFVFDSYIIDNHWAIHYKREAIQRIFHPARKLDTNPIFTLDNPSYVAVTRESDGPFRMYYQANIRIDKGPQAKGRAYRTLICYAESDNGTQWTAPDLKLFPHVDKQPNNVVIAHTDRPTVETCSPFLLDLPEKDCRGKTHWVMYRAKGRGSGDVSGIRAIATGDGIHFDPDTDTRLAPSAQRPSQLDLLRPASRPVHPVLPRQAHLPGLRRGDDRHWGLSAHCQDGVR